MNLLSRMIYKGSIITPLVGEHSEESVDNNVQFTGDFAKPSLRAVILSGKHRYSFNIKLRDSQGELLEEIDCDMPDDYLTADEMRQLAQMLSAEQINECQADVINLAKSTITISLLHEKKR
ncbi:hypothetical protein [Moraxella sp. ZY200743]|uniref:hypothetical protein n=1 Tax=Moraxella sp. ZY200743 TaxID=2911970 RepID=UPI003D7D4EEF